MQRCIIFIVLSAAAFFASAQPVDVRRYELSFTIDSFPTEKLACIAEIEIRANRQSNIRLECGEALQIESIAWRQGRIKEYLSFTENEGLLSVTLPESNSPKASVLRVAYNINLTSESLGLLVKQNKKDFLLNPLGMQTEIENNSAGVFFPAVANDAAYLGVNLSCPEELDVNLPGQERFTVTKNKKVIARFWETEKVMLPQYFYLALSTGKDDLDFETIDEEYAFSELAQGKMKLWTLKQDYKTVIDYLDSAKGRTLSDDELLAIDSISSTPLPQTFITEDVFLQFNLQDYLKFKAGFYQITGESAQQTGKWLIEYVNSQTGPAVFKDYLQQLWQQGNPSKKLISLYGEQYVLANPALPDSLKQVLAASMDTSNPALLSVSYTYLGGQKKQALYIEQDTSATAAFEVPVLVTLSNQDSTTTPQLQIIKNLPIDTLYIPFSAAPRSVSVEFGEFFPGYVEDKKPDYYALYDLSNASSKAQRLQALNQLFNTQNKNLYSTVVGIALRDESDDIRLKALQAAERVNAAGKYKVKEAITNLAEKDPNPEIQQKATALLNKLYAKP